MLHIKRQDSGTVCRHEQTAEVFEELNIYKNTNNSIKTCRIHRCTWSRTTRFKCIKIVMQTRLHKCLNFLLQLNIFKNTYNTHQKMQNSSLYTIKDSSATRFKCYNTSNDKIQQLYADTNKLHKCLNFLLELNIFKNTNNTHQNMQNSSLYMITPLLQPDSNATIH